jgi:hypothetical protein
LRRDRLVTANAFVSGDGSSMEDRVATRANETSDDDQDDAEQDLSLEELNNSDDDEGYCDEPK